MTGLVEVDGPPAHPDTPPLPGQPNLNKKLSGGFFVLAAARFPVLEYKTHQSASPGDRLFIYTSTSSLQSEGGSIALFKVYPCTLVSMHRFTHQKSTHKFPKSTTLTSSPSPGFSYDNS